MRTTVRGLLLTAFVLAAALDTWWSVSGTGQVSVFSGWTPVLGTLAYALGRLNTRTAAWLPAVAALLQPFTTLYGAGGVTLALAKGTVGVCFVVLPWLLGRYLRERAAAASVGWERAELLEREQEVVAERERLRERARLAEETHDTLGHELSLIAVRAGSMQVSPAAGEEELRGEAGELREDAVRAMERLQEIMGILRDTDGTLPGGAHRQSVTGLVASAREAGMSVRMLGAGCLEGLPEYAQHALYRVAREALTNADKHASGAAVALHAEREARDGVTLRVSNDPPPEGAQDTGGPTGGSGLAGLGEYLRSVGGTVRSGPRSDGGFEVVARLPRATDGPRSTVPGSGVRRQFVTHRRRVHRALATSVAVPAGAVAVLTALWLGYYGYVSADSVLEPDTFHRLRIGEDQRRVEDTLPDTQMLDPPRQGEPPDAACQYYRTRAAFPGTGTEAYRLCFTQGQLTTKETVRLGSVGEEDQ
ncbi:signal transduction histidine kinase [Haloactinospora alba]|uniref:histidine kinase n=1 Tax=Haloactinospora alba TaxID=405555 RepID=A0A543NIH2_9ACTN|nr:sensor histidine kinase [Haloactinospora alba]TQN31550.1 signal transduction histidine kinase [Haloactinospora alba]